MAERQQSNLFPITYRTCQKLCKQTFILASKKTFGCYLNIGRHSPFVGSLCWEESVLEIFGRPLLHGSIVPVGVAAECEAGEDEDSALEVHEEE